MTSKETAKLICSALSEKKAIDIKIIQINGISDLADYFIVCSGSSSTQVKALFEHVEEVVEQNGIFSKRKEGMTESRWIAIDYGEVVVHIFHKDTREFYQLDKLWNNGTNVVDYKD